MNERIGTKVDVEFFKGELPSHFLELCKYQQDIIDKYEEFIEKLLHMTIEENVKVEKDPFALQTFVVRHVTIPETRLIAKCSPACRCEWEYLKAYTPRVSPDYFIEMAYKEREEKRG